MRLIQVLSPLLLMVAAQGADAADVQQGAALARQWCIGCHAVENQTNVSDLTPSFRSIARRRAGQTDYLKMYLVRPHAPMPPLNLSNREIDDLAAYILSIPVSDE